MEKTYLGGMMIVNDAPSKILLVIPKIMLGNPDMVNVGVITTGRGRVHTAGDVLGSGQSPSDWHEELTLQEFFEIEH